MTLVDRLTGFLIRLRLWLVWHVRVVGLNDRGELVLDTPFRLADDDQSEVRRIVRRHHSGSVVFAYGPFISWDRNRTRSCFVPARRLADIEQAIERANEEEYAKTAREG